MKQLIIVVISCGLVACAGTESEPGDGAGDQASGGSDCILQGTVRDYRVLNDSNLAVTASGSRKYHIELSRPAIGMQSAWQIAFVPPGSRICAGFSELLVDDNFRPEKIRISHIVRISDEEYEDLLIRFGHKEPEIEQAQEPAEVEGAELEELD